MISTVQPARTAVYVGNAGTSDLSVFLLDPASGAMEPIERVPIPGVSGEGSSTPMALGPGGRVLYVGFRGQPFIVASFAIDGASGRLTHIGNGPLADNLAYLSVDPTGRYLFGASYFSSRLTVNPIAGDGKVLPAIHIRETGAKAHCALVAPDGRHVFVTSLGTDRIQRYGWEPKDGELSPKPVGDVAVAAGAGPRHIVFHPNGRAAYLVNELNGTVDVFAHEDGALTHSGTVPIMPEGDRRKPWAADIHITPDGRFLYASERTSHTISGFAVDADGIGLQPLHSVDTQAEPRGFNIDPSGACLVAAGQATDHAACYRIDPESGFLTPAGTYQVGASPNWIEMVSLQAD